MRFITMKKTKLEVAGRSPAIHQRRATPYVKPNTIPKAVSLASISTEMSPLQGSKFYLLLRRALPYANEWRPFRAETSTVINGCHRGIDYHLNRHSFFVPRLSKDEKRMTNDEIGCRRPRAGFQPALNKFSPLEAYQSLPPSP